MTSPDRPSHKMVPGRNTQRQACHDRARRRRVIPLAAGWVAAPSVLGGGPAAEGAWPSVVELSTALGFACTGTLVAPDRVLTPQ